MTTETINAPETPAASVTPAPVASETANLPAEGQQPPGSAETETPPDEQPKKPKVTFSERISQIHAARKEAEARAQSATAERDRALAELDRYRKLNRDEIDPSLHNRIDIQEALQTQRAQDEHARAQAAIEQAREARGAAFISKVDEARATMPDIDQALSAFGRLPVNDAAADIIADSDKAAEIAYYLGRHPVEAMQILNQPIHLQAAALARLEQKLTKPSSSRKTSQAPAPVQTVGGVTSSSSKALAEMTMDEYVAARKAGKV